ncbi:MAG: hypothetical protein A2172_02280 [Candidatus Woykebacteria bacterium RBG_13_40_15]|uniref:Uncharacterized protein n=1 Tax=Candidatus Woykebacteria bacterium RBG_13_40_15 TaxID=1802593 RepID=A0A1G1W6B3_9BACT|nr:MAG: hypothetical protein A2172_02280 [Candidatus Woykebacteria bacterium RBG_13_40_15]
MAVLGSGDVDPLEEVRVYLGGSRVLSGEIVIEGPPGLQTRLLRTGPVTTIRSTCPDGTDVVESTYLSGPVKAVAKSFDKVGRREVRLVIEVGRGFVRRVVVRKGTSSTISTPEPA